MDILNCNKSYSDSITNHSNSINSKKILNRLGPAENYYKWGPSSNKNALVVLLYSQRGPLHYLLNNPLYDYERFFHVAYVHQAQNLKNRSEKDGLDARLLSKDMVAPISMEKARQASMKSAAILHKVAKHFKAQNKTVYLVTESFGSFIIPHTLTYYGNNFDKILIKAGRLKMPKAVVAVARDKCSGTFNEDGVTFEPIDCEKQKKRAKRKNKNIAKIKSKNRLQVALRENNYIELLQDVSLKNVKYIYGKKDKKVGKLTNEEIDFLKKKGATVEAFDGGHALEKLNIFENDNVPGPKTLQKNTLQSKMYQFFTEPLPSTYDVLTMPNQNEMEFYLGQADKPGKMDKKYDIGILFENHSKEQVSYKLNALFGEGPFSLFKTLPFRNHRDKFRIQFGVIHNSNTNESTMSKDTKLEIASIFKRIMSKDGDTSKEFKEFISKTGDIQSIWKNYLGIFRLDKYKNKKEGGQALTQEEKEKEIQFRANHNLFINFFKHDNNKDKNFDTVIYVSPGLSGSYANSHADTLVHPTKNVIYLKSGEFFLFFPYASAHPSYFAIEGVHELGHILGGLFDEYENYQLETLEPPASSQDLQPPTDRNKFRNNCFVRYITTDFSSSTLKNVSVKLQLVEYEKPDRTINFYYPKETVHTTEKASILDFSFQVTGILNPWTHKKKIPIYEEAVKHSGTVTEENLIFPIKNYDGSLYGGCNGGTSFRGTKNSIMRKYYLYNAKEWPKAWGPINTYYLKRALKKAPFK